MSIVTLPKESLKYMDEEKIEVDIPDSVLNKLTYASEIIKNTRGIWKNKDIDPRNYQKEIRSEWQ
ncbi:MAG: hypothetical protein ACMUJM_23145 [bacterium]